MKRLLAITTAAATVALGVIVPAAAATASTDDLEDTTWDTSIEHVATSWSGSSLTVKFDWDTLSAEFESATFTTSVDGADVNVFQQADIDYGTKTVTVSRPASAAPAGVAVYADFCLHDDDADFSVLHCNGGRVYAGTVLNASKGVKSGQASALTLLNRLSVKKEAHAASYKRSKFTAWNDANRDGENTRVEVLKAESSKKVRIGSNGAVTSGRWRSRYDGKAVTADTKLSIDHLVPLQEAWTSGASGWSAKKREAYANDLGYAASLIAVTKHAARSKGGKDPSAYLPPLKSYDCTYVKNYVAVKSRWKLSVDSAEKAAITKVLATCSSYGVAKPASPVVSKLVPKPKKSSAHGSSSGGSSSGGSTSGVDPRYGTCTELLKHPNHAPYVRGVDAEYDWYQDRDGDGRVCE